MVVEFAGAVGPVSHVTLCPLDAFDQVKVTTPAAAVSGVGLKELLLTVTELPWPPLLLPVESLQAAKATATTARTARRANFIKPPKVSRRRTPLDLHPVPKKRRSRSSNAPRSGNYDTEIELWQHDDLAAHTESAVKSAVVGVRACRKRRR